ncbi:ABC transporter substrate-binding protein [Candidatus Cardinium hertigii]|uniref:Heme-binding protein A n=1 Tax=Candidatus Cardinium hertigii TaxID=247481 RepID=A0A2Z3LIT0_9BACT|nr:ABC transporter substrate-binding protein [Candidatus Cardinium hertigii]AWN81960.1 Heme-binding protein A [Candidatus Cardinium hertigii]
MSRRIILYLVAVGVFVCVYYRAYRSHKALPIGGAVVFHNVAWCSINGIDPLRSKNITHNQVVRKIYEGLYSYHPFKKPLEIVPNLAEALPSISPDRRIYTFKIKKGILFQDDACFPNGKGREVTAADFVFSFKRMVDPNHEVLYIDLIQGKIKGLDRWRQQAVVDYAQEVEGLQAVDDYTLQITLIAPWSGFLNFLTMPISFVVAREAVDYYGPEFINHPVGTGPFKLEGVFNPQAAKIEFVKNPTFRKKLFPDEAVHFDPSMQAYVGRQLPLVDRIVTCLFPKKDTCKVDLNRVDNSPFALKFVKDGKVGPSLAERGLVLYQACSSNTELFIFNNSHPLFARNSYLRQAMSMAFDREMYNRTFYHNAAKIAQSLVPPVLMKDRLYSAYKRTLKNPYAYDLRRAKQYLAKAGFPAGKGLPEITLDTSTGEFFTDRAYFFARCMAKIGIRVRVIANVCSELDRKSENQATMMHMNAWVADDIDPLSFLQVVRTKNLIGLYYENPTFNRLFDQAETIIDKRERAGIFIKLSRMVAEEVPVIGAVHAPIQFLHQKWVKNVFYSGIEQELDQYIAVDMAEKSKAAS